MTHDMAKLFALRERDHYGIHRRHLNEQMVRVLKAIGCDVGFCRGKG
jgi:ornithine--oxo-acid transaminase